MFHFSPYEEFDKALGRVVKSMPDAISVGDDVIVQELLGCFKSLSLLEISNRDKQNIVMSL